MKSSLCATNRGEWTPLLLFHFLLTPLSEVPILARYSLECGYYFLLNWLLLVLLKVVLENL